MIDQEKDWEKENARLRREVERLRKERSFVKQVVDWVTLGPDLAGSIKSWRQASSPEDPFPEDETAQLVAAGFRRVVMVGIFAFLTFLVPTVLLWQQNQMFRAQNALIFDQNQFFQHQIAQTQEQFARQDQQIQQQLDDTYRVRKAELLQIIYGKKEGCQEKIRGRCLVVQEQQIRSQTVRAFIEIESGRKKRINLRSAFLHQTDLSNSDLNNAVFSSANLNSANLKNADLSNAELKSTNLSRADLNSTNLNGAYLSDAELQSADLSDANLDGSLLRGANLSRANLYGADLSNAVLIQANLKGAILSGANLNSANLSNANLNGTDLSGADLSNANLSSTDLSDADLSSAENVPDLSLTYGASKTQLPPNTLRPEHWGKPREEQWRAIFEMSGQQVFRK